MGDFHIYETNMLAWYLYFYTNMTFGYFLQHCLKYQDIMMIRGLIAQDS